MSKPRHGPRSSSDSGTGGSVSGPEPVAEQAEELERIRHELIARTAEAQGLEELLGAQRRELDQLRTSLAVALAALHEQLERVERSRAWRYGHGLSRVLSRAQGRRARTAGGVHAALGQVDRALELLGIERPAPGGDSLIEEIQPPRASREEETAAGAELRRRLGPPPELETVPSASIVVVSRAPVRTREFLGLMAQTDYPDLTVVIVDNASVGSAVSQEAGAETRVRVLCARLEAPCSYSEACNQGASLTESELLVFVNDDVRPLEAGWLRELVKSQGSGQAEIVGATIVSPQVGSTSEAEPPVWPLEQRGITIGFDAYGLAPVRRGAGSDLFGEPFGDELPTVAVSGACLLVPRRTFTTLGGFATGYQYGLEDVDLCLRARKRGLAIACSTRAVVVHDGSSSQRDAGREFRRINHAINRRRFHQMWGPSVRRDRLSALLRGDPIWGEGAHLVIARTSNDPSEGWGDFYTGLELGHAALERGWRVSYVGHRGPDSGEVPPDADLAVVLIDRLDPRIFAPSTIVFAWVRNWTERWLTRPWLDRYDGMLASSRTSLDRLRAATGRPVELFPLATNPERFRPRDGSRELDWVFTGNRWGTPRAIEPALYTRSRDRAAIYGRGWQRIKKLRGLNRGEIPYEQLPAAYGSAKLVLDDTAEPTLSQDAVNARVFDALASGTLVLTNCEKGARELFDEDFPTWTSADELQAQLTRLLNEPERRAELVTRYRETVLGAHTYAHRAGRLQRLAEDQNELLSFCLKIGAPDWEQAERWGDLHLATALGRALRRRGHRWHVDILPDWHTSQSSTFDVAIHLRGRSDYSPAPGQYNVLWLISHPESFDASTALGYDLVCVASAPFAEALRERLSQPVHVLDQATDPRVFFPDPDPELEHELLFVGNSRGVQRKILADLIPTGRDLAVWGGGWSGTAVEPYVKGEYFPNRELRRLYSSAKVVLCDHWPDMRAAGFRSNRLYDALACGAVVISDRVAGLDGVFGDAVLTYEDPEELSSLVDRLLLDEPERRRRAAGGREEILRRDTFDERAHRLLELIEGDLRRRNR